jgi:hypothetical protein
MTLWELREAIEKSVTIWDVLCAMGIILAAGVILDLLGRRR